MRLWQYLIFIVVKFIDCRKSSLTVLLRLISDQEIIRMYFKPKRKQMLLLNLHERVRHKLNGIVVMSRSLMKYNPYKYICLSDTFIIE